VHRLCDCALVVGVLLLAPARRWWLYLLAVVRAHVHMVYRFQQPEPHRHAAATRVSIDLRNIGKQTHLLIRDDDHGLDNRIDRANGRQPGGPLRLGVGIPRNERKNATAWWQT
jgi:hypothetical protein